MSSIEKTKQCIDQLGVLPSRQRQEALSQIQKVVEEALRKSQGRRRAPDGEPLGKKAKRAWTEEEMHQWVLQELPPAQKKDSIFWCKEGEHALYFKSKKEYYAHMLFHSDRIQCWFEDCKKNRGFKDSHSLVKHVREAHWGVFNRYVCQVCAKGGELFWQKRSDAMKQHMAARHSNQKSRTVDCHVIEKDEIFYCYPEDDTGLIQS